MLPLVCSGSGHFHHLIKRRPPSPLSHVHHLVLLRFLPLPHYSFRLQVPGTSRPPKLPRSPLESNGHILLVDQPTPDGRGDKHFEVVHIRGCKQAANHTSPWNVQHVLYTELTNGGVVVQDRRAAIGFLCLGLFVSVTVNGSFISPEVHANTLST